MPHGNLVHKTRTAPLSTSLVLLPAVAHLDLIDETLFLLAFWLG
jgi:hypothetical protein